MAAHNSRILEQFLEHGQTSRQLRESLTNTKILCGGQRGTDDVPAKKNGVNAT
jgi:hypothetical protein